MKKKYQYPEIYIVKVHLSHLMQGSFNGTLGGDGGDGSQALGREYYYDDDEWDEQFQLVYFNDLVIR